MEKRGVASQSELARLSKVPQATISRILKGVGEKGPETTTLKKLAAALGIRFEWLADDVGEMLPSDESMLRSEGWSELTRVDAAELRLLTLFRRLDPRGQRYAESVLDELVREHLTSLSSSKAPDVTPEGSQRTGASKAHYLQSVEPGETKKHKP